MVLNLGNPKSRRDAFKAIYLGLSMDLTLRYLIIIALSSFSFYFFATNFVTVNTTWYQLLLYVGIYVVIVYALSREVVSEHYLKSKLMYAVINRLELLVGSLLTYSEKQGVVGPFAYRRCQDPLKAAISGGWGDVESVHFSLQAGNNTVYREGSVIEGRVTISDFLSGDASIFVYLKHPLYDVANDCYELTFYQNSVSLEYDTLDEIQKTLNEVDHFFDDYFKKVKNFYERGQFSY